MKKIETRYEITVRNYQDLNDVVEVLRDFGFDNFEDVLLRDGIEGISKNGIYWITQIKHHIETGQAKILIAANRFYWWLIRISLRGKGHLVKTVA